jgi:ABC-type sugar transport system substrate-binding protein
VAARCARAAEDRKAGFRELAGSDSYRGPAPGTARAWLRVEGKNIEIEVHFVDGNRERTQNAIRTLVQKGVDILIVRATPAAHIAKAMTQTIPIVMQVSDPLATGLVKSLSHPGGNVTGVANSGPDLAGTLPVIRPWKKFGPSPDAGATNLD